MSGEADYDLTGEWRGIYNYPAHYPPNQFEATIRDSGGQISGVLRQPAEFFESAGVVQHAVIEGSRSGAQLSFVKIYDDLARPTPHYRGTIQPGGDEVEGEWTIPGDWSGTFLMVRGSKAEQAEARKTAEKVWASAEEPEEEAAPGCDLILRELQGNTMFHFDQFSKLMDEAKGSRRRSSSSLNHGLKSLPIIFCECLSLQKSARFNHDQKCPGQYLINLSHGPPRSELAPVGDGADRPVGIEAANI